MIAASASAAFREERTFLVESFPAVLLFLTATPFLLILSAIFQSKGGGEEIDQFLAGETANIRLAVPSGQEGLWRADVLRFQADSGLPSALLWLRFLAECFGVLVH